MSIKILKQAEEAKRALATCKHVWFNRDQMQLGQGHDTRGDLNLLPIAEKSNQMPLALCVCVCVCVCVFPIGAAVYLAYGIVINIMIKSSNIW